jgi:uncharacterized protein YwgA
MSSSAVEITERQLIPLSLLEAAGGEISGRTRLQKLAFLLVEEELDDDFPGYDFVKYNYGPFSKTLLSDIEQLEQDGAVSEEETKTFSGNRRHDYELNDGFESVVSRLADGDQEVTTVFEAARRTVSQHNDKALRSLIEDVYDEYPEYAENSVYER